MRLTRFIEAFILAGALSPVFAYAAPPEDFGSLVDLFIDLIYLTIPVIFGLTFLVFLWGIAKAWILHPDEEASVMAGKRLIIGSTIAFIVMFGVWGIVSILYNTLF